MPLNTDKKIYKPKTKNKNNIYIVSSIVKKYRSHFQYTDT